MTGTCRNSPEEIWFILGLSRQGKTRAEIAAECNVRFKHTTRSTNSIGYVVGKWKNDPQFAVVPAGSGAISGANHPRGLQHQQYGAYSQYQQQRPGATGLLLPPGHSPQIGFIHQASQNIGQAPTPSNLLPHINRTYQTNAAYLPKAHNGSAPHHAYPAMQGYRAYNQHQNQTPGAMGPPLPKYSPQMGLLSQTQSIGQAPRNQIYQANAAHLPKAYDASAPSHPYPARQGLPPLQDGSVEDSPHFILHRPSRSGENETIHLHNKVFQEALNMTGFTVVFPPFSAPPGSQIFKFYNPQFPFSEDMKDWFTGDPVNLEELSTADNDDTDALLAFESDRSQEFAQPPVTSTNSFTNPTSTKFAGSLAEASHPQVSYHSSSQLKRPNPRLQPASTQYTQPRYNGLRNPARAANNMNAGSASSNGYVPISRTSEMLQLQLNHQQPYNSSFVDLLTPSPQPAAATFAPPPPSTWAGCAPQKTFNPGNFTLPTPDPNYDPLLSPQPAAAVPFVPPLSGTGACQKSDNFKPGTFTLSIPDPNCVPLPCPQAAAAPGTGAYQKTNKFNPGNLTLPTPDPNYVPLQVAPLYLDCNRNSHVLQEEFKSTPSMAPKGKTSRWKKKAEPLRSKTPERVWIMNDEKTGLINLNQNNASLKHMKNYLTSAEIASNNKRKADQISASEAKEREESSKKPKVSANNEDTPSDSASKSCPSSSSPTPSIPMKSESNAPSPELTASPIPPPQLLESHIKKRKFDQVRDPDEIRADILKRRKANFERDALEEQDKDARRKSGAQYIANQTSKATSQEESVTASPAVSVSTATPCQCNGPKKRKLDDVDPSDAQEDHEKRLKTDGELIGQWSKEFNERYPDPFDECMDMILRDAAAANDIKEPELPDDLFYASWLEGLEDVGSANLDLDACLAELDRK